MLKLEEFWYTIQYKYAVYIHPHRLWIYRTNFFWETTNKNAYLSLGTGMGFSYCVHLFIKPKTWQFWATIDRVKKTRKDCGYRLTKTRWILPLLSAMSVDGAPLLKGWQPIIVNFSEKINFQYHIYIYILYYIILKYTFIA